MPKYSVRYYDVVDDENGTPISIIGENLSDAYKKAVEFLRMNITNFQPRDIKGLVDENGKLYNEKDLENRLN